ncbi:hypothetical protein NKG94_51675 [Micromonospora sp. M12]
MLLYALVENVIESPTASPSPGCSSPASSPSPSSPGSRAPRSCAPSASSSTTPLAGSSPTRSPTTVGCT